MLKQGWLRFTGPLSLLCLVLASTGCGPSAPPTGSVKGTVTYNGAPLSVGHVNFLSAKGDGAQAILKDGAYTLTGELATGDYSVYVSPPLPEPLPPGTAPKPAPPFDVPAKFQQAATSELKATVKPGANDIPIAIK